jgi:hypothetical protein
MWMTGARSDYDWAHTAQLLALTANCHRDPKKRPQPFQPRDFHPKHAKKREAVTMGSWGDLKRAMKGG